MALDCPHCNSRVPLKTKLVQGSIRTSRGVQIVGGYSETTATIFGSTNTMVAFFEMADGTYRLVCCAECGKDFIADNAGKAVIWPLHGSSVPDEVPAVVRSAVVEAKRAHAVGAETAALLTARTALIRLQRDQKCKGIDDLVDRGVITRRLAEQAHEVRLWANVTGHEDVPDGVPAPEDVDQLLAYLDILLNTIFVQPAKLTALKDKRANISKSRGSD